MTRGKLVVISGPSAGVGKDTILKMFLQKHPDWVQPTSTTTRAAREGELNGKDMIFVDQATFEQWQKDNSFLESIQVDNGQWYGTQKEPVERALINGKNVILRIDVRGAMVIKEKIPEAILVFITAENEEALEQRIRNRGSEDEAGIQRRLELAKSELPYAAKYDHVVVNPTGHPEQALVDLEKAIGI